MEIRQKTFKGHSYKFVCNPIIHYSWWSHDDELQVREAWWDIQKDDVVFDIGAALGSYLLPALACGASYCVAFSPLEGDALGFLSKNLEVNDWQDRVKVFTSGLWSDEGWLRVFPEEKPSEFYEHDSLVPKDPFIFPVDTLDNLMKTDISVDRLDWYKIDVEGAELEVLKGSVETLTRFHPKVIIESHLFKNKDLTKLCTDFLKDLGYKLNQSGLMGRNTEHLYFI